MCCKTRKWRYIAYWKQITCERYVLENILYERQKISMTSYIKSYIKRNKMYTFVRISLFCFFQASRYWTSIVKRASCRITFGNDCAMIFRHVDLMRLLLSLRVLLYGFWELSAPFLSAYLKYFSMFRVDYSRRIFIIIYYICEINPIKSKNITKLQKNNNV